MTKNNLTPTYLIILLVLALVTSCTTVGKEDAQPQASEAIATVQPSTEIIPPSPEPPTPTLTSPPPTATSAPTATPSPLSASDLITTLTAMSTSLPSPTPTSTSTATMSSTTAPGAGLPGVVENSVRIYFIQLKTGGPICGDSLVPVATSIARTGNIAQDVEAALDLLFSYKSKYVGNLYNPVHNANLRVSRVNYDSGLITVNLVGTITRTKDRCENTRLKSQIWTTIKQFKDITSTSIYLNSVPMGDLISND